MAILKPSVLTSSDKFSFLYKNLFWLNTKDTILSQTPPSTIFVGFFKYIQELMLLKRYRFIIPAFSNFKNKNDKRFKNRGYTLFSLMDIFLKHLRLIPNISK